MKKAYQLVHTLSYGDAISGEVLALKRCFADLGYDSQVYSINSHPRLKGEARDYRDFPSDFAGELILHYSLGSPLNSVYVECRGATRSVIYHNLTPAKWFRGINPRVTEHIEAGVTELPGLLEKSDRILADSAFNASELKEIGFDAEVLDLPVDPARWGVEANPGIAGIIKSDPRIHILHVGRLAPNKCIEDIIRMFYFLHHHITHKSKLWLVGIDIDTELYSFSLKRLVHELKLDHAVEFAGCLADGEVKALYENCSAYLCMSEHEGFCLPVAEAMYFGLPVIAYASSALPETIGQGGVLVHAKKPAELAELVHTVCTDEVLKEQLVKAGRERVAELSYDHFARRVSGIFSQSSPEQRQAAHL